MYLKYLKALKGIIRSCMMPFAYNHFNTSSSLCISNIWIIILSSVSSLLLTIYISKSGVSLPNSFSNNFKTTLNFPFFSASFQNEYISTVPSSPFIFFSMSSLPVNVSSTLAIAFVTIIFFNPFSSSNPSYKGEVKHIIYK